MEMQRTHQMVEAEVMNLLASEWERLVAAYINSDCELGIALKINLKGNLEIIQLEVGIEYYPLPKTRVRNDKILVDEKQIAIKFSDQ